MWAQLITARVRPGKEGELEGMLGLLEACEQPDSGLVRQMLFQDQADAGRVHFLIVMESEEKARARERDPRREEGLQLVRAKMGELFDGPPEFTDMRLLDEIPR